MEADQVTVTDPVQAVRCVRMLQSSPENKNQRSKVNGPTMQARKTFMQNEKVPNLGLSGISMICESAKE